MLHYAALIGRIFLLGYERIILKQLGLKSDYLSASLVFFLFASVSLLPFAVITNPPENFNFLLPALISGFIYSLAFFLYVKSLTLGEASLVSPLYNFNVLFLMILASIFLNESITLSKTAGILLLLYGASFLKKNRNVFSSLKNLFFNTPCRLMILSSLLTALGRTVDGFFSADVSPIHYAFAINTSIFLYQLIFILLKGKIKNSLNLLKKHPVLSGISGFVNGYSYMLLLFAFKGISVSIAEPASMLSLIITAVLAFLIFKENIKERLTGSVIMIAGAGLLFY